MGAESRVEAVGEACDGLERASQAMSVLRIGYLPSRVLRRRHKIYLIISTRMRSLTAPAFQSIPSAARRSATSRPMRATPQLRALRARALNQGGEHLGPAIQATPAREQLAARVGENSSSQEQRREHGHACLMPLRHLMPLRPAIMTMCYSGLAAAASGVKHASEPARPEFPSLGRPLPLS
ncbi:hypothetical protein K438DRAFT_1980526 [Mycena galopus ATCC 62051]|nr:hypothetical protein K438DRAFT_1980526 [Mycena galopus ATCC 62051]